MTTLTHDVVRIARKDYGLTVYERSEWGSAHEAVYARRLVERPVRVKRADTVVQHITVTRPSGSFFADCRAVERIGFERFGSGVSYNFLVNMKTGEIAVGQPLEAKGTHTVNDKGVAGYSYDQNHAARAIAVVGMPDTPLSPQAVAAIAGLLAAMTDAGAITEGFDYVPHSLFAWKDCPCEATRSRMPEIRQRVTALREKPAPVKPVSRGRHVEHALNDLRAARKAARKAGRKKRSALLARAVEQVKKVRGR